MLDQRIAIEILSGDRAPAAVPLALALGLLVSADSCGRSRGGQYDDLDGAGWRAIMDDEDEPVSAPGPD